jgi:acetylornithine aminotransferase/acetylornithine/N-succinyldiaminopimelate aminotransferase
MTTHTMTDRKAAVAMNVQALEAEHVLQVYKRANVVFERGEGVRLIDSNGRAYLDFISGVGVCSLGHGHAKLAAAIADQAKTLLHTSNLFYHPLQGELATRLATLTGLDRAFFCNSGAEAVEACLKFSRRFWKGTRTKYVAFTHSFHGRSMGALSVTWDDHYRAPFAPLIPNVVFVDVNDPAALTAAVDDTTAAIIVEPIQGEGGVRPISPAMVAAINAACAATGTLLIADEIQCGSGRTGAFTYSATLGLAPDLMALAKALGAGVPIGAAMFSNRVAAEAAPGDHGSTYGGNLLACRAALVFLDELGVRGSGGVMDHVRAVSAHFDTALARLKAKHASIVGIRGAGVFRGIDIGPSGEDAGWVVSAALERGLLVNRTSTSVIRLLPPFIITEQHIDEAVGILDAVLQEKK